MSITNLWRHFHQTRVALTSLIFLLMVAGCGDGGVSTNKPAMAVSPVGLSYSNSSIVYTLGQSITPNRPTNSGGPIARYDISPALPAGLNLNATSGVISGTPVAVAVAATYTITGQNVAGSATARIDIEIKAAVQAPETLTYQQTNVVYTVGHPISANSPVSTGGPIASYSATPDLPRGVLLDTATGVISGTPLDASTAVTYAVTGTNSAGSISTSLVIEVDQAIQPPVSLSYSDSKPTYVRGHAIVANHPIATGGPIDNFSVQPALPSGLNLDAATGAISGAPTEIVGPLPYTVTASNVAGSVSISLPIAVIGSGQWNVTGSMSQARYEATSTLLRSGKLLMAGGWTTQGYLFSSELYDPATGQWSATGSLNFARYRAAATLLPNGKVLVAGGIAGIFATPLSTSELYDPATEQWVPTGSLSQSRFWGTATLLANGKVLLAGGGDSSGLPMAMSELYDPETGRWSSTGGAIYPRFRGTSTLLSSGKVLVAGGFDVGDTPTATAELYDPATGLWSATGNLSQARTDAAATLLSDGRVLVTGGQGGRYSALSSAELYDPTTGLWSVIGTMAYARSAATATELPSGKVVVAGGYDPASGTLSTSELYDPVTGKWSASGSLSEGRYWAAAVMLPSVSKVLVIGGFNGNLGAALSTSELYDPQGN